MAEKRDYYEVLGVPRNANKDQVKDIFRGADFDSVFRDLGVGDLFRAFFGNRGGFGGFTEQVSRGQDLGYDLERTLEEAARGRKKKIEVPRTEKCEVCGGS